MTSYVGTAAVVMLVPNYTWYSSLAFPVVVGPSTVVYRNTGLGEMSTTGVTASQSVVVP